MNIFEKLIKRFPKHEKFIKGLQELEAKKIKVEKVVDEALDYRNYHIQFTVADFQFRCTLEDKYDNTMLFVEPGFDPSFNLSDIEISWAITYNNVINLLKIIKDGRKKWIFD